MALPTRPGGAAVPPKRPTPPPPSQDFQLPPLPPLEPPAEVLPLPAAPSAPEPAPEVSQEEDWDTLLEAAPQEEVQDWGALLGELEEEPPQQETFPEAVPEVPQEEGAVPEVPEEPLEEEETRKKEPRRKREPKTPKPKHQRKGKGFLGRLYRLPLIGRLLKPLGLIAPLVALIFALLPLALIAFGIFFFADRGVASEVTATGPDNAAVVMGNFTQEGDLLKATLSNQGEVIGEVDYSLSLMSYKLTSPFSFQEVVTCSGTATVGIDETIPVELSCPAPGADGLKLKVTGHLNF